MNVVVIGGGASGMIAALTAARNGHQVTLLERQARVGRKLLATGNGRCNMTNTHLCIENYHGHHPSFAEPALRQFSVEATLEFFHSIGLITTEEPSGRVYPFSDQAGSVVDVLRFALDTENVRLVTGCEVTDIVKNGNSFIIRSEQNTFQADRVIVCCGGAAGAKLGGSTLGYRLLQQFGHSLTHISPALVQIKTDTSLVRSLKGVRADAHISIKSEKHLLMENDGEIQFTDYGISGPAVFEVSRTLSESTSPLTIHLDFLRQQSMYLVERLISSRIDTMPQLTMENLLTGMLHNRLGRALLVNNGFDLNRSISTIKSRELKKIAGAIKDTKLEYKGTCGFDQAQVTVGGISTAEFDSSTMQSNLIPGLYAAGEILDIDGDCGGYNLQWAWSSAHLAGLLIE